MALMVSARLLDDLAASANEAGWSTHEIVVAILEAGRFLEKANAADPDPAEDRAVSERPHKPRYNAPLSPST